MWRNRLTSTARALPSPMVARLEILYFGFHLRHGGTRDSGVLRFGAGWPRPERDRFGEKTMMGSVSRLQHDSVGGGSGDGGGMSGIRIGTSGWSYDHWNTVLYEPSLTPRTGSAGTRRSSTQSS